MRWHVDDHEPANNGFGLRERAVGNCPIGGYDAGLLPLHPTTKDPYPSLLRCADNGVGCFTDGRQFLLGDLHSAIVERDQVPRHPETPLYPSEVTWLGNTVTRLPELSEQIGWLRVCGDAEAEAITGPSRQVIEHYSGRSISMCRSHPQVGDAASRSHDGYRVPD